MRVPDEYAKAADAEVIVRLECAATGKLEVSKKLSELPKIDPNGTLGTLIRKLAESKQ